MGDREGDAIAGMRKTGTTSSLVALVAKTDFNTLYKRLQVCGEAIVPYWRDVMEL